MKISIPAPAEGIIGKLNEYGYEAYVVGGCVRDMMLGREPEDWDITTSALPDRVKQMFRRTVDTGIQHGAMTMMMGNEGYEVTTYHIDGEYSDGHHPNHMEFTPNLAEDLKRRDFAINAVTYNSRAGFVNEFGGAEDLKKGIIRCVEEPMDRFTEDALRILRAIRFSAQLGFLIEDRTYGAIRKAAPNMVHVSKERIQTELTKLLLSSHPGHIELVYETGISSYVSDAFHRAYWREEGAGEVPASFQSAVERADRRVPLIPASIAPEKHMRWAGFLRRCTPDHTEAVLKDLKLDNGTINKAKTLVHWQGTRITPDKHSIRVVMSRMEPDLFDDLLSLKMCLAEPDLKTGGPRPEAGEELELIARLAEGIRYRGDYINLKTLAVSEHDIMKAGVKPGKEVGAALAGLLEFVLEDPKRNTREILLQCLGSGQ